MSKDYNSAIKLTGKILDAWLPWKLKYGRVPGMSVGIVYRGKLVYAKGFGYADIAAKKKMTAEHRFRIASISKSFTAFAVLQLAEKGKIGLDDRIGKYLPWFPKQAPKAAKATIRQLLMHTAGVFRDGDTPHWENDIFPDRVGFKRSVSKKTAVLEPLTKFKYSNFGYSLLGEVIRTASGMSYEAYVARHIIKPLGMNNTFPDLVPVARKRLAKGYSRIIPGEERKVFTDVAVKSFAPAAGFISSVPDLAKYLAAWPLGSGKLVDDETKKEMMRQQWPINDKGAAYGFGLRIMLDGKRKNIGHGGGFAGFITQIWFDPESEIGVIVLSNANGSRADAVCRGIFETIYRLVDESRLTHGRPIAGAKRYEGVYRARWFDGIVIGLGAALAVIDPNEDSPLKNADLLFPSGRNRFLTETVSNYEGFGEVTEFRFKGKGSKASIMDLSGVSPAKRIA